MNRLLPTCDGPYTAADTGTLAELYKFDANRRNRVSSNSSLPGTGSRSAAIRAALN
jgi:hypothetical protein